MTFLKQIDIDQIKSKMTDDLSQLGKIYKAKSSPYLTISIDHSLVEDYKNKGWEVEKELKTKTRLFKAKSHNKRFEDEVWCQFYQLGYRYLNYDENFKLPYGKETEDLKQIDVIAVDKESVIIIECKSSSKPKKSTSLKTEFEGLEKRLDGFRKSIDHVFGRGLKVKYIYATRNLRIELDSVEIERLHKTGSFYYNDNTYLYINNLIKNYKVAASYQLKGLIFKDQLISTEKIEVPAVEGTMGMKTYYIFSLEPHLLLKMGFVLHRTKANESEMPTYQRLIIPSRLKGITKFINDGGYFPNSIIVNFTDKKHKIQFEASARVGDSKSRYGMLKIPNAYAIAYIIDGQHRIYGYANTIYKENNTVPVVAFRDLDSTEQLEIFMDINQNQKAVSPSLRLTLEEDLYWDSERADSRLKALRSSIVQELADSVNGSLYNKIGIGEDKSLLTFQPFVTALQRSGLLPIAKGNKYDPDSSKAALYDIHNQNHRSEMRKSKNNMVKFLNLCYGYIEENHPDMFEENSFILSNRGSYAYINLLGSLNFFETIQKNTLNLQSSPTERFEVLQKYIDSLILQLKALSNNERELLLDKYGTGADLRWFRTFQLLINKVFPDYEPDELIEWKERQDKDLQSEGRGYGVKIEKYIKSYVLDNIQKLFSENWELEINSIKRKCMERAQAEMEKNYKEGLGKIEIEWTEMFTISDYKSIIEKYWAKKPENHIKDFKTYENIFSIDIGEGIGSKVKAIKWISRFNSLRNSWAHAGTKEKGLSKEEVEFLKMIHNEFYLENE